MSLPQPGKAPVKILNGTVVELEATYPVSSKDARTGDVISFHVACPVIVDGVTLIAAGAVATGIITVAEKGDLHDQSNKTAWNFKEVAAVDGTAIPLQPAEMLSDGKNTEAEEQEMIGAALTFPVAPLALLFLSRQKGDRFIVRSGDKFRAFVQGDIDVQAQLSEERRV